jgi:serine/threonine protein phosphatase PrpC
VTEMDGRPLATGLGGEEAPTSQANRSEASSPDEDGGSVQPHVGPAAASRAEADDRTAGSNRGNPVEVGGGAAGKGHPDGESSAPATPRTGETIADAAEPPEIAESGTATGVGQIGATEDGLGVLQSLEWAPGIGDEGHQREIQPSIGDSTVGVSDTEVEFVTVAPFEIRACATRGWSHRQSGAPRQDFFAIAASGDWLVAAVADGVSSGAHSHVAALTAARAATRLALMEPAIPNIDWQRLCDRLSWRIVEEAKYRGLVQVDNDADASARVHAVREVMSTTVVIVALSRRVDADGRHPGVLALLAGDSAAYRLSGAMVTPLLGGKNGDGYITSGRVHPLPGARSPIAEEFALEKGQGVLLTSDGLSDPLGEGAGEVGQLLGERWSEPPSPVDFFADLNFLRRSFDDDRTAVGIWA